MITGAVALVGREYTDAVGPWDQNLQQAVTGGGRPIGHSNAVIATSAINNDC